MSEYETKNIVQEKADSKLDSLAKFSGWIVKVYMQLYRESVVP